MPPLWIEEKDLRFNVFVGLTKSVSLSKFIPLNRDRELILPFPTKQYRPQALSFLVTLNGVDLGQSAERLFRKLRNKREVETLFYIRPAVTLLYDGRVIFLSKSSPRQ